ncbi:hypothetical protein lerEdw1_013344 [Lerista edwardsae]|nr:hypothetical protein lerEdw1_013344 [Lerista edwardsae]
MMESSWNGCSSVPGYSDDTFASFTEGEEETCRQYEDDPFNSYYSAVSEQSESTWQSSSLNAEGETLTGISEVSKEALGALQAFCAVRINQLCQPPNSIQPKRKKRSAQRHGSAPEKPLAGRSNCIVLDQLVNRLHLQNVKETMKQLAEAEMHQPSGCPHCQKKKAELAEDAFLRRKKYLLEKVLLEEKLEELVCTKVSWFLAEQKDISSHAKEFHRHF